MSMKIYH